MPRPLRCFVAVDFHVPRRVRTLVDGLADLRPAVRPVKHANLHVTLQFLGDVELDDVRSVDRAVGEACAGTRRFEVELVGLGAFPNPDRPSVVWIGVEPEDPLVALADRLGERLGPLGFPPEPRRYTPHLTVARVKSRPGPELFDKLAAETGTTFGRVKLERAVLFQSDLGSQGVVYAPLATYRFDR